MENSEIESNPNPLKLVSIGGGKGQAAILGGLKKYNYRLDLAAIVSMVDNGGSTGRLSEELGIPPFGGDFKDVLTALTHNQTMIDLWQHRYERGSDIKGHTVGNLILLGLLEQSNWDIPKAIEIAREILDISAQVYPSTLDRVDLVAKYSDGDIVKGQDEIDNSLEKQYKTISKVYTEPAGQAYEGATQAIREAHVILLCPGDLYGSLLCNLVIPGMQEAIAESQGKIIYITNLMTKINQTHNWGASRFIAEVQKYLPRPIDYALVNSGDLSGDAAGRDQYKEEHWEMVQDDTDSNTSGRSALTEAGVSPETKIIADKIWHEGKEFRRVSSDVIPRSFIRHDPAKIAEMVMGLLG